MTIKDIVEQLDMEILAGHDAATKEVHGGYTSDLLSDVMANSREGMVWITLQIHQNIIAVAKLKELAGIILINSRRPEEETLKKAEEEGMAVLSTSESAFAVSGQLFQLLEEK